MGLTVISNIASTISSKASAPAPEAAEGQPGGFAALLSGQTMAAMMSLSPSDTTQNLATQSKEKGISEENDKAKGDNSNLPLDPAALVAMIGNSQSQPAIAPPIQAASEVLDSAQTKNLSLAISPPPQKTTQNPSTQAAIGPVQSEAPAGNITTDAANLAAAPETSAETINFNTSLSAALQPRGTSSEHQVTVRTPLHTETWPQQFGEKIVWLAKNDQQSAQININPPELGPVQITLSLNGDQASAVFSSPHAEVRQAIEASMPQLKEMFSAAGISLGNTNVGANLAQQNPNNPFTAPNKNQSGLENAILPANDNAPNAGITQVLHKGRGLVDLFA